MQIKQLQYAEKEADPTIESLKTLKINYKENYQQSNNSNITRYH